MQLSHRLVFSVLAAGFLISPMAMSQEPQAVKPVSDAAFVKKVGQDSLLEVRLGKLAQEKAESQDVKDFAKEMETDHSAFNKKFAAAAQEAGMTAPTTVGKKSEAKYRKLSDLSGAKFDKAYVKNMVKGHTKVAAMMRSKKDNCDAQALCKIAAAGLPMIEDHLTEAEKLRKSMGMDTATKPMKSDSKSM